MSISTRVDPAAPKPAAEAGRALSKSGGPLQRAWSYIAAEYGFWANVLYDARRFRKHAWMQRVRSAESRAARMMADAHFLEYGMALKQARPGFGLARAERLAGDLIKGGVPPEVAEIGLRTLEAWRAFNADITVTGTVSRALACLRVPEGALLGGVQVVQREEIQAAAQVDFTAFVRARHSIRAFAPGAVSDEVITRAVRAAQEAPSSCNRQTCHAHVWTDREMIDAVRKHQAGNRTFGNELAGIAVITSDMRHWEHTGERYQAWIDGGLFAMTLAYALHAEGLGTCMLNWSVTREVDQGLRQTVGLGDEHLVVVLLGFGHLPDSLSVCRSQRQPVARALSLNPPLH